MSQTGDAKSAAISALKRKRDSFEAAMRLLEEADDEVISVLKATWGLNGIHSNGVGANANETPPVSVKRGPHEHDLNTEFGGGLRSAVRAAVMRCEGRFTVNTIYDDLAARRYSFDAKRPKSSIAEKLRGMVSEGFLQVVRKSAGGPSPVVYERSKQEAS